MTEPPTTGHPRVDAALATLTGLEGRPAREHVAVFDAVHEALAVALSSTGDTAR